MQQAGPVPRWDFFEVRSQILPAVRVLEQQGLPWNAQ
jgi:hypothetical protein